MPQLFENQAVLSFVDDVEVRACPVLPDQSEAEAGFTCSASC